MQVPETEIIVTKDGAELLRKTVRPGDYVIGRETECDIYVAADLVSRRHAQLTVNYDHALVEDLGSSNGTFINGRPVTEITRLWPNQKLQIGAATVELRRLKTISPSDVSLAPTTATVRRFLPSEFLHEKKYDIGGIVAQGGMGAILNAKETTTERTVAMKVMLNSPSPEDMVRFITEAKVTAQLEHPSIVPVYELSVDENDNVFYTMKFVRGITLRKILELLAAGTEATIRKYPFAVLLTVFQKVCDAIAFAHNKTVIHRDLKPENIMIGDFGEVLVMDWGLAKVLGERAGTASPAPMGTIVRTVNDPAASSATMAGAVMGTPQFMAPEQARGEVERLDARADIYSLGAILYQILALRAPIEGNDAWEIVDRVGAGKIDSLDVAKKYLHMPGGRMPDSLAAVVRKAMALKPGARYASVPELQKDIEAYQGGFATSAERAGTWKQLVLLVKRNKTASIGMAAVLLVGSIFGTKAVVEGRRAERALSDLKRSAPALLQLAESEADSQRFDSALEKIDAAVALDPSLSRGHWRRAWILIAQEKFATAADALRLAKKQDPANALQAAILPQIERMAAAASDDDRFASELVAPVFRHLLAIGASGESAALARRIKLGTDQRMAIVRQRLDPLQKSGRVKIETVPPGLIQVVIPGGAMSNLEILRGLPFDILNAKNCGLSTLEPLRGVHLTKLDLNSNAISDLSPLQGMSLVELVLSSNPITDLSPLKGMPLRAITLPKDVTDLSPLRGAPLESLSAAGVNDLSPLEGAPLKRVNIEQAKVIDLTPLRSAPLTFLSVSRCYGVRDLSPLRGMPLETLLIGNTAVTDLAPLRGAPLKELNLSLCKKVSDYTPILTFPLLERLICDVLPKELLPLRGSKTLQTIQADAYPGEGSQGARPVAEFWRAYDTKNGTAPK